MKKENKKANHGGKRAGSGRKAVGDKLEYTIRVSKAEKEMIINLRKLEVKG